MYNPKLSKTQKETFDKEGYLIIKNVLTSLEIELYRNYYTKLLELNKPNTKYRSDLGGHVEKDDTSKELITQVMVPSRQLPELLTQPLHERTLQLAIDLLGNDMALDFDMLIDKAPFTNTITPWHQDRAYWISMPDTRALSCWVALDNAIIDNGCMWYIPGSHLLPVRPHMPAGKGGGALVCNASEEEGVAVEISAGDCVIHHGGTIHYSRGNSTALRRRAFITNFRPQAMIDYERAEGYDHTGERKVRDKNAENK